MTNKRYDQMKLVALVILPALATLVVAFNIFWDMPHHNLIVGLLLAVDTYLGVVVAARSSKYQNDPTRADGYLSADGSDELTGHPNLNLVITRPPNELFDKNYVLLKVGQAAPRGNGN